MKNKSETKKETKILEVMASIPIVNVVLLGGYGIYALIRATKRGIESSLIRQKERPNKFD